ncbi:MAG: hypothetical protein HQK51_14320 [Oligoflexia bacterium]|nr:hypothetical protein [Oligoflexia bacterium]
MTKPLTTLMIAKLIEQKKLDWTTTGFGETFQYSNFLVAVGGFAAIRIVNKNDDLQTAYASTMDKLVFKPLKMKNTVLDNESAYKLGAAYPHIQDFNEETQVIPSSINDGGIYSISPAGAIWSRTIYRCWTV